MIVIDDTRNGVHVVIVIVVLSLVALSDGYLLIVCIRSAMLLAIDDEALKVALAAPCQFNAVRVVALTSCKLNKITDACGHYRLRCFHWCQRAVSLGRLNSKAVTIFVAHRYHFVKILAALEIFLRQLDVVGSVVRDIQSCKHRFGARTPDVALCLPCDSGSLGFLVQHGMHRTCCNIAVLCRSRERGLLAESVVPHIRSACMRTPYAEFIIQALA